MLYLESDFFVSKIKMVEKFLEYAAFEKRYSPHTITSYRKDLEDFQQFYIHTEASYDLLNSNKKVIRNFIVHLSEQNISKRSINRKLSTLRSFFTFLLKIGEISVSPLETISSLKFYAEKQIPFSEDEMDDLKKNVIPQKYSLLKEVIIETLYQTGIRKAELCNLLLDNVDFAEKELKIIGKGNKERVVPISEELCSKLMQFSDTRKPLKSNEMWFFINQKGKKLNEKFVYSTVNSYFSIVTSKKKKSPHILRHSFATHVLNNGAEISKVKKIMGHASLASTQVYTNADIEQLKKVFDAAHPRAKKE